MSIRQFPSVLNPPWIDATVVVASIVLVGVGFALLGVCGGGDSLVLFGIAVALLYVPLSRAGAWATLIPICIMTITLVAAGWYVANGAGCRW
jgi:hypothetical protein